jgi:hypothetical protein
VGPGLHPISIFLRFAAHPGSRFSVRKIVLDMIDFWYIRNDSVEVPLELFQKIISG